MPVAAGRPPVTLDLGELYAAHRLSLVRLAVLLVDDRPSAEDVVQDAFAGLAAPGTPVCVDDFLGTYGTCRR